MTRSNARAVALGDGVLVAVAVIVRVGLAVLVTRGPGIGTVRVGVAAWVIAAARKSPKIWPNIAYGAGFRRT